MELHHNNWSEPELSVCCGSLKITCNDLRRAQFTFQVITAVPAVPRVRCRVSPEATTSERAFPERR